MHKIYLDIKLRDTGNSIGDVCNGGGCGERVEIVQVQRGAQWCPDNERKLAQIGKLLNSSM